MYLKLTRPLHPNFDDLYEKADAANKRPRAAIDHGYDAPEDVAKKKKKKGQKEAAAEKRKEADDNFIDDFDAAAEEEEEEEEPDKVSKRVTRIVIFASECESVNGGLHRFLRLQLLLHQAPQLSNRCVRKRHAERQQFVIRHFDMQWL